MSANALCLTRAYEEMSMIGRIAMLAPLAIAALAVASPAHADALYQKCIDNAQNNQDFGACGVALVARREVTLNRMWKTVYDGLNPAAKPALLAEQRVWIAFKEKSCAAWQTGVLGREGEVIHFYICRAGVIDARIETLRYISTGGDIIG
jgi:uncharacterized protein YecT (DUF1311 family)